MAQQSSQEAKKDLSPSGLELSVVAIIISVVAGYFLVPKQYKMVNGCFYPGTGSGEGGCSDFPIQGRAPVLYSVEDPMMQWTYRVGLSALVLVALLVAVHFLKAGIAEEKAQRAERLRQTERSKLGL